MKESAAPSCLLKGLEEEVYTGTFEGEVVGLSHRIVLDMPQYKREPDSRNVEYTTEPMRDYNELGCSLMSSRLCLREYLQQLGGYTLVPGSTLSLESESEFRRSQPDNPYHAFIEENYGTRVVTTSCHINIGVDDPELLMRAWRVVRMETCLFLALTACSPFFDGRAT
ncbi:MAG: glutamate-cysteine ligase family protein, partial [Phycisphaerae bacterium]|nr:glutamate-cysteine ligase family protein [Phycisphaerae bacterium]